MDKGITQVWLNARLDELLRKQYSQPMTPEERLKGGASALPIIGDAISGYDAFQSAKKGNYGEAALNAAGLLPFLPALAGVTKKHTDDIMTAILKEGKKGGSYGFRIIPGGGKTPEIGDVLDNSFRWANGEQTGKILRGTSTAGLSSLSDSGILKALHNLGIGDNVKIRPYYFGDDVVLVKGTNRGRGTDKGERVISGARVVWRGKKANKGFSDLAE